MKSIKGKKRDLLVGMTATLALSAGIVMAMMHSSAEASEPDHSGIKVAGRNDKVDQDFVRLKVAIRAALNKTDSTGCPKAKANINPVSKSYFWRALKVTVADNIKPEFTKFTPGEIHARWKLKGRMQRVCIRLNGRGH